MTNEQTPFLTCFPDHCYRYLDRTGSKRKPVSSHERIDKLNIEGFDCYFTPNGFANFKDNHSAVKENCTSLNSFWVDIDGRKDWNEMEELIKKFEPTFILETFRGYHCYWLLDEPIYRNEITDEEWQANMSLWEKIEQSVVDTLKGDNNAKDIPRILRVPDTYYWEKGSGDRYMQGTLDIPKIIGRHKNIACRYSMEQMEEAFPIKEVVAVSLMSERTQKQRQARNKEFFNQVFQEFPMTERTSFKRLISGQPDTLPPNYGRNTALVVTATLMRQAGWTEEQALTHIKEVGWHGMEKERDGWNEIKTTIESGMNKGYIYSNKHELIAFNKDEEEETRLQGTYTAILKVRKEQDKTRFSNYEEVILADHPYLKKNDIGMLFDYKDGYYQLLSDQDVSDMILNGLKEDILWNYRTSKNVNDKILCLRSIVPYLELTNDGGNIVNVKNGLLHIRTRILKPHTPTFVSLIQYPVVFDPNAICPTWEDCVKDWTKGDEEEEKIRLLKQFCGYIASSSMRYDRALFMVGDGGNGKSTFIDTISMVIGKNATSHIDLEGLYGQFGMKGLVGKRLNVIEEVHNNYYQSNKLKKLISGEQTTIDSKYKDQFTFRPQAKFVFSVNQMPRVDDVSTATERRICAITFKNNYRLNPNTQLRYSEGLLAQELSGILNWMLDGAEDLADSGNFVVTREQTQMLKDYREENSSVEGFMAECTELSPDVYIETPELYSEYKKWCQSDGGRKPKSKITFNKELRSLASKSGQVTFKERTSGHDEAKFIGIKFNPLWTKQETTWARDFNNN